MNIVIPMGGHGRRFEAAGYTDWKPLIQVAGAAVIDWTLRCLPQARTFLVVRPERIPELQAHRWERPVEFIPLERENRGPGDIAPELLWAGLHEDESLMIANADQYVEWDPTQVDRLLFGIDPKCRGVLATFDHPDLKWSFVRQAVDEPFVEEVRAKDAFGVRAVVGIYAWRRLGDFAACASRALANKDFAPNGELYVCPLYNYLDGVGQVPVRRMMGLGDPADLQAFARWRESLAP